MQKWINIRCNSTATAPDVRLALSGETWSRIYLSQATPESLIESGDIEVTGDTREAVRLINLFDRFSAQEDLVIPTVTAAP